MKFTLNWLKQYVDCDWSPDQLAERLTMLGLAIAGGRTCPASLPPPAANRILPA
jgi:hypothetical protein